METDARIGTLNIDQIINTLDIKHGDSIADIGAGSGLFTFHFSKKIGPKGIVYAADINRSLLDHIEQARDKNGIKNIITVLAAENDPKIPKQVDLIFLCDTLHYIDHQENYLRRVASYVKIGGQMAVIDFKKNWPPSSIKFSPEDLKKWMGRAGFDLTGSHDFIPDEFFMIFKKTKLSADAQ
jgi:arsenite methyltransferase